MNTNGYAGWLYVGISNGLNYLDNLAENLMDDILGFKTINYSPCLALLTLPPLIELNQAAQVKNFFTYISRGHFSINDRKIVYDKGAPQISLIWKNHLHDKLSMPFYRLIIYYFSIIAEEPFNLMWQHLDVLPDKKLYERQECHEEKKFDFTFEADDPNSVLITSEAIFCYRDTENPDSVTNELEVQIQLTVRYEEEQLIISDKQLLITGECELFEELVQAGAISTNPVALPARHFL